MDFYKIITETTKKGTVEIYPDFVVGRTNDLMVRGKCFYAVWDETKRMWSTDEYDVARLIDEQLWLKKEELAKSIPEGAIVVKTLSNFNSGSWRNFRNYVQLLPDNAHQLDEDITFANSKPKKRDYRSKTLQYELKEGSIQAYEEIITTLYDNGERAKLEWAIGAIIAGDAKTIQKFLVLYGAPGTGKGTILNIIQKLFEGYYTSFESDALAKANVSFATETFKDNPPLGLEFDGDLSKLEANKTLNTIVSHELVPIKEKFKPVRYEKINTFLMLATNSPVKISDAKSGLLRRLIDVNPSGRQIPSEHYDNLVNRANFELGAIAHHCLGVYKIMGKNYYKSYNPVEMVYKTDLFFNFVEDSYNVFSTTEYVQLKQAFAMYKEYCEDSSMKYMMNRTQFREALIDYFDEFHRVTRLDGMQVRSVYSGFKTSKFDMAEEQETKQKHTTRLLLSSTESPLDIYLKEHPAQLAKENGSPTDYWKNVKTTLADVDTTKLHWVKLDENHIVIDFDLKDETGEKSLELNQAAAEKFPVTYAEYSKGGAGIHLHYFWDGDVTQLSRLFDTDVEVKVFTGDSALRRKLTFCNNEPITHLNSGLPLKGEPTMINEESVKNERHLRSVISKALRKEVHPGTKPNVDFIYKMLDDAYNAGISYDVSDMYNDVYAFANNSSHQSNACIKLVGSMQFKSEEPGEQAEVKTDDDVLVIFDIEVFPNLFLVNWKYEGTDSVVRMINPSSSDIAKLLKHPLIGFNNRRYDNHILYAAYLGFTIDQLYKLSQRIISGDRTALFAEAYGLSYTDVYDFSSKKQSLKKFEIELGLKHHELGLPWDEPVPEELWVKVAEYCDADVIATEAVFHARSEDFAARQILAEMTGLTVNDTTQKHVGRLLFGDDKNPQKKFVYTDLSKEFPGYVYERGVSTYRNEVVGEGGYVFSIPGMYWHVGLFDIASMHPTTIKILNLFGIFTAKFVELMDSRLAIKHKNYEEAAKMLEGILEKYLVDADPELAKKLSYSLKIVINIVYGLTSAKFENLFKDPRNVDNIVAKRGALFMIDLKHAVQDMGYTVAHIKTDSIKIPNYTEEIKQFIIEFGNKYGYTFEHEATYEKMALVNDAVYIAKYEMKDGEPCTDWTATGAQFAHPYVFKHLFTKEQIDLSDMQEVKSVQTSIYLDYNENLEDVSMYEQELGVRIHNKRVGNLGKTKKRNPELAYLSDEQLEDLIAPGHDYNFVGKVGAFTPVKRGVGGGRLMRLSKDNKYHSANGATGYRWFETERVAARDNTDIIDLQYYRDLCDKAIDKISEFGNFDNFVDDFSLPC